MEEIKNVRTRQEPGLLDLLVTLAENIKLLILGSLAFGLSILGVSSLLPSAYQSVAVVQADQSIASLMMTTSVLDPVIASLGLATGLTMDDARRKLRENIKIRAGGSDKLLTLTVSQPTAQQAQAVANAILQQTYREYRPKSTARARLVAQLVEAQERLQNGKQAGISLLKRLQTSSSGADGVAELARGYAELLNATGAAQNQIAQLETQLEGLSESHLVQAPTLPHNANQPKKGLMAAGATLMAGLVLLLFIFIRQALRNMAGNSVVAGKLARIRQVLGLHKDLKSQNN